MVGPKPLRRRPRKTLPNTHTIPYYLLRTTMPPKGKKPPFPPKKGAAPKADPKKSGKKVPPKKK